MSATIHVHGPFAFTAEHVEGDGGGFVVVRCKAPGTHLAFIRPRRAELDDLIRAARQAKDLLPGDTPGGTS